MELRTSIITINRNNAEGLEKTLKSVNGQSFKGYEHIVIDGNSTDRSKDIIHLYAENIRYWISEPDNGIYHAMNKGISRATGEYCFFLNSGDVFYDNTVLEKINGLKFNEDIICFDTIVDAGNDVRELVPAQKDVSFYFLYTHTIIHQSMLIKSTLFKRCGLYNEGLKIASDWEFCIKAIFLHQASFKSFPLCISIFDATGLSSNLNNYSIANSERAEVLNKYFGKFLPDYELIRNKSIYTFLKHLNNHKVIKSVYILKFRLINKIAKLFRTDDKTETGK